MNYSYWENKEWFNGNDFTIVGSGIVGLTCAISLREKYPYSKIIILEKGVLPQGASTKNAGFACFGSVSELLSDLKTHTTQEVVELVSSRWQGLKTLRKIVGDKNLDYQHNFGYELFLDNNSFGESVNKISYINELLIPLFGENVFNVEDNKFSFKNCTPKYIKNSFEGQIDTGKMMSHLLKICLQSGVKILNNTIVNSYSENNNNVKVHTNNGDFSTSKLLFATNGFSKKLMDENIVPARAQVLVTKPIDNLKVKGTFHLEQGYYYFRNIDQRILIGGGRNLDFKSESTMEFGQTSIVQSKLEELLKNTIIPNINFEIDYSWSGIMGIGNKKKPILKQLSNNVSCGVRLGGMGVALGASVGRDLADLITKS
jgi:glycine/D-amino acid oxidase-like deaminating enzyme